MNIYLSKFEKQILLKNNLLLSQLNSTYPETIYPPGIVGQTLHMRYKLSVLQASTAKSITRIAFFKTRKSRLKRYGADAENSIVYKGGRFLFQLHYKREYADPKDLQAMLPISIKEMIDKFYNSKQNIGLLYLITF